MSETPFPAPDRQGEPVGPPCRDLHVYHVRGFPGPNTAFLGPAFLGNWQEEGYAFLFFSAESAAAVERLLRDRPDLTLLDKYHMRYSDWHGEMPEPFRAGRFLVYPPWEPLPPEAGRLRIELDPGVVFGTGTHATTRDCLEAIDALLPDDGIRSALDLGTGTGLLALAAARLRCRHVVAVDLNRLAVQTAVRNVLRNGLQRRVLVVQGRAETLVNCRADLLIANVHHAVMRPLVASAGFSSKRWFILSGLLRSQAKETKEMLIRRGASVLRTWHRDGTWITMLGRNRERAS